MHSCISAALLHSARQHIKLDTLSGHASRKCGACSCCWLSYMRVQGKSAGPLEAANMLWLIQRDFLQGASVQAMVSEALQTVANPGRDPDIEQVQLQAAVVPNCPIAVNSHFPHRSDAARAIATTMQAAYRSALPCCVSQS